MSNSTDTPKGYKQSPLGQIPEDWNVERLFNIADVYSGGTPKSSNLQYFDGNIPFIKSGEIGLSQTEHCISEDGLKASSAKMVKKGDLLYALYGATSGQCAISKINGAINQAVLCIRPQCNRYFLLCVLEKNKDLYYRRYLQGGQGNLSAEIVKRYYIPIPSIEEQMKIAEVLSTWDKAIELQTAIIEKLTLRKKGLMQRLLTGKKRLKGFTEPWRLLALGCLSDRITRKNIARCSNVVTVSAQQGFVKQTDFFEKTIASDNTDNYYLVKRDEFCYNKSYSLGYPMGAIKRLKDFEEAVVTTLYIVFRVKETELNLDFFEQYCECGLMNNGLLKVANEGGRAHGLLNVTPKDFFNLNVMIPDISEQKVIAGVLVYADNEIEKEKQKLAALKQQKKGLMQQLLTGKKRVVV